MVIAEGVEFTQPRDAAVAGAGRDRQEDGSRETVESRRGGRAPCDQRRSDSKTRRIARPEQGGAWSGPIPRPSVPPAGKDSAARAGSPIHATPVETPGTQGRLLRDVRAPLHTQGCDWQPPGSRSGAPPVASSEQGAPAQHAALRSEPGDDSRPTSRSALGARPASPVSRQTNGQASIPTVVKKTQAVRNTIPPARQEASNILPALRRLGNVTRAACHCGSEGTGSCGVRAYGVWV